MKHRLYILIICSLIGLSILACSTFSVAPTATNPPPPTATLPPPPTATSTPPPTATPVPFVPGECEGEAIPILMNTDTEQSVQAGSYPDACEFYCLWVPDSGTRLDIGISNFNVDLDLYVDTNISVLAFEDHGTWESNAYGDGDESVSIFNPGGRYYIQVCSYEGLASTFLLNNLFVP
jgi:hypothetical protein